MKYRIVSAGTCEDLEAQVQICIEEGWTPLGGCSVSEHRNESYDPPQTVSIFVQAMTQ